MQLTDELEVPTVPFGSTWTEVDLATAEQMIAHGHDLVEVVPWEEVRPPSQALRVEGSHPSEATYPLQQRYSLLAAPGSEEAAVYLAPHLASLLEEKVVLITAVGDINLDQIR